MSNWIETIREAADILDDAHLPASHILRGVSAKKLRAIADEMQHTVPVGNFMYNSNGSLIVVRPEFYAEEGVFPLFTYPPDAQSRIAELEAQSAEILNDAAANEQLWRESRHNLWCKYQTLEAQNAELILQLESIAEYWNRDQNETAMADACWYAINTAEEAIAKVKL